MQTDQESSKSYTGVTRIIFLFLFLAGLYGLAVLVGSFWGWPDPNSSVMQAFRGLGQFMSGIAAVALLILALQKLPAELQKFNHENKKLRLEMERGRAEKKVEREESRDEKKTDTLAFILDATHRVAAKGQAFDYFTSPLMVNQKREENETNGAAPSKSDHDQRVRQMLVDRFGTIKDDLANFFEAKIKARIYLEGRPVDIINEIEKTWRNIDGLSRTLTLYEKSDPERSKVWADFFDYKNERRERLQQLVDELFNLLKPEVRMTISQPKKADLGLIYVLFASTVAEPKINHHTFDGLEDVPYISEVFGGDKLEEAKMLASALKSQPTVTKVKIVRWIEGQAPQPIV